MDIRTRQLIGFGTLSGVSVGTRFIGTTAFDWLSSIEEEVLVLFLSIILDQLGGFYNISIICQMVLYAWVIYYLYPRIFSRHDLRIYEIFYIRVVFVTWVVGVAVLLIFEQFPVILSDWPEAGSVELFGLVVILFVLFFLRLLNVQDDPVDRDTGYVYNFIEHTYPVAIKETEGEFTRTDYFVGIIHVSGILVLFAMLTSVLLVLFDIIFPLVELGIIAFVGIATARNNRTLDDSSKLDRYAELDVDIFKIIPYLTYDLGKGAGGFFSIFLGLAISGIVFVSMLTLGPPLLINLAQGNLIDAVAGLILVIWGTVYGLYGLWFWYQIGRRFPAFLKSQVDGDATTKIARPSKMMAVPSLFIVYLGLWIVPALGAIHFGYMTTVTQWVLAVLLFGGAMVCAIVNLWHIFSTHQNEESDLQPLANDDKAIAGAFSIQSGTIVLFLIINVLLGLREDSGANAISEAIVFIVQILLGWTAVMIPFILFMFSEEIAQAVPFQDTYLTKGAVQLIGSVYSIVILGGGFLDGLSAIY